MLIRPGVQVCLRSQSAEAPLVLHSGLSKEAFARLQLAAIGTSEANTSWQGSDYAQAEIGVLGSSAWQTTDQCVSALDHMHP